MLRRVELPSLGPNPWFEVQTLRLQGGASYLLAKSDHSAKLSKKSCPAQEPSICLISNFF